MPFPCVGNAVAVAVLGGRQLPVCGPAAHGPLRVDEPARAAVAAVGHGRLSGAHVVRDALVHGIPHERSPGMCDHQLAGRMRVMGGGMPFREPVDRHRGLEQLARLASCAGMADAGVIVPRDASVPFHDVARHVERGVGRFVVDLLLLVVQVGRAAVGRDKSPGVFVRGCRTGFVVVGHQIEAAPFTAVSAVRAPVVDDVVAEIHHAAEILRVDARNVEQRMVETRVAAVVRGEQVVVERSVLPAPDAAEPVAALGVERTAQALGEDAPLHREIFVGIERRAFVRAPADRTVVDQDVAAVATSERILVAGRRAPLVAHAEPQVAQDDVVGPDGHAETCDADAVARSALPCDREVAAGDVEPFFEPDDARYLEEHRARVAARHGPAQRSLRTVVLQRGDVEHASAASARGVHPAALGGVHIEGGYLSPQMKGGQDSRYIKDPAPEDYDAILAAGGDLIARWTFAPELPGSDGLIRELARRGIQMSMGHTSALFDQAVAAYDAGVNSITHFYSMTSGVTRRDALRYAGVIEAGYLLDGIYVETIGDGVHLPEPLLRLIWKVKGPDRIVGITDAMRGAGMPDGPTVLGSIDDGVPAIIEDGVAKLPDRSSFAGSVCTADRVVRNYLTLAGASLPEAVQVMTLTPARLMRIDGRKGSIAAGKDADIVLFDKDMEVSLTMIGGRVVYCK